MLRQQSREAFDYLYQHYAAALYGVIRRIIFDEETAKDVLQESFVKIWNHIDHYDSNRGRIYTWMINIARHAAIDKLRSKGEVMRAKIRPGAEVVHTEPTTLKTEVSTDVIGLGNLVTALKPEYAHIVQLAYYEGYTLDEISKTLDIPLGTVKTRMRHAIKILREHFSS